ncbi:transposase [Metarhizium robertsii ARSEF 23]|uniref:Transposase n=1 Tax=Metarhizium robertsii (strain ARSEF 23 / ATCC MYA-3075) TaxID=655844 RepID=A0A0B2XHP0_METRA|nr:transposase [Metarhizium robertsii ARSEF 23]KHO11421.1 transposase [Metarhizium robertsii ARSEF 23]
MANQQPDFNALGQHLEAAAVQFRRFSNIPRVVEAQRLDRLENRLDHLENRLNSVQNERNSVQDELNDVQDELAGVQDELNDVPDEFAGVQDELHSLKNQTRNLFNENEIDTTRNPINNSLNQNIAQLTSLQGQNTSFLRQTDQNRITQNAREYNSITKNLNRNGITINPRHRLLPLRNIFTGITIDNCPRTRGEIHRLSQREVDRLLTLLDLPRHGTLNQKRLVLADSFC